AEPRETARLARPELHRCTLFDGFPKKCQAARELPRPRAGGTQRCSDHRQSERQLPDFTASETTLEDGDRAVEFPLLEFDHPETEACVEQGPRLTHRLGES